MCQDGIAGMGMALCSGDRTVSPHCAPELRSVYFSSNIVMSSSAAPPYYYTGEIASRESGAADQLFLENDEWKTRFEETATLARFTAFLATIAVFCDNCSSSAK